MQFFPGHNILYAYKMLWPNVGFIDVWWLRKCNNTGVKNNIYSSYLEQLKKDVFSSLFMQYIPLKACVLQMFFVSLQENLKDEKTVNYNP